MGEVARLVVAFAVVWLSVIIIQIPANSAVSAVPHVDPGPPLYVDASTTAFDTYDNEWFDNTPHLRGSTVTVTTTQDCSSYGQYDWHVFVDIQGIGQEDVPGASTLTAGPTLQLRMPDPENDSPTIDTDAFDIQIHIQQGCAGGLFPPCCNALRILDQEASGGGGGPPPTDQLTISQVTLSSDPASPAVGDTPTMTVQLRNDGTDPLTGASPSVQLSPSSVVTSGGSLSPISADLAAGATASFTMPVNAVGTGPASAVVNASATGSSGSVAATAVTRMFTVGQSPLSTTLSADPTTPSPGHSFTIKATVTNGSANDLSTVAPVDTLVASPSTGVTIGSPTPTSDDSLASHATTTFTWTVTATDAAMLHFSVAFSGSPPSGPTVTSDTATLDVTVAEPGLVVNTTGDETNDPTSSSNDQCDVDVNTDGSQCTLRAAIELANARTTAGIGAQSITFDISGGGTPTISPQSALPVLTGTTSIDGTTQTGSWVALDGSNAGSVDGLAFTGSGSSVRGLVISNFGGAGVRLSGGSDVVAGDRLGTDPGGTGVAPNSVAQVVVDAGTANVVGGESGTTPEGACTGDCNVIADGTEGVEITGSSQSTTLQGNHIGVSVGGGALLNSTRSGDGIFVTGDSTVNQIGDASSANGRNVIDGGTNGIRIDSGFVSAQTSVVGNFVGIDTTGQVALGNGTGVHDHAGNVTVGGTTATAGQGAGNVISGNTDAAGTGGVVCDVGCNIWGNLIGLAADGSTAVPNRVGIVANHDGFIGGDGKGNVVSGNLGDGIDAVGFDVTQLLIRANLVGTNRSGTAAVGNGGSGIDATGFSQIGFATVLNDSTHHDPTAPDATTSNLVAGNQRDGIVVGDPAPGVDDAAPYVNANVNGNIVGLGADGETPLPNGGRGIVVTTEAQTAGQRSQAVVNLRDNHVGSNAGTGIAITAPDASIGLAEGPSRLGLTSPNGTFVVAGNLVGVDRAIAAVRSNGGWGLEIIGLANVQLLGNEVGGNGRGGVHLHTTYAVMSGNQVGVAKPFVGNGASFVAGNAGPGISLQGDDNVIGGTAYDAVSTPSDNLYIPNEIANNSGPGVLVTPTGSTQSVGNSIRTNTIYSNAGIPIDLSVTPGGDGPTPNRPNIFDGTGVGPNDLLNHPVLDAVVRNGGRVVIAGYLKGLGGWGSVGRYAIDVYDAGDCAGTGTMRYLGTVLTSIVSNGQFTMVLDNVPDTVSNFVATATSPRSLIALAGDTSEATPGCQPTEPGTFVIQHSAAGATEVQVADNGPFSVGDTVIINRGGPNQETAVISAKGSLIFSHPLAYAHEVNETIVDITPPHAAGSTPASPAASVVPPAGSSVGGSSGTLAVTGASLMEQFAGAWFLLLLGATLLVLSRRRAVKATDCDAASYHRVSWSSRSFPQGAANRG